MAESTVEMPIDAKQLFRHDVLRPHLHSFTWPENLPESRKIITRWATMFSSGRGDKFKEQELLPDFLTDVFCNVLGYTRPADNAARFTFTREKHIEVDGKIPDAVLGNFLPSQENIIVALEGKGPRDPLDRPFAGRKLSAVDQGYGYAINLQCDWIIVTSMRETRLYFKGTDKFTYERFESERLANDDAMLKKFLFLLGAARVVPETGRCHLFGLREASEKKEKDLTKSFYGRYAEIRRNAFEHLCRDNPSIDRKQLLGSTQKLLDRILFCAFCEDRGLLPPKTIQDAYQQRNPYNPQPIWHTFRGLFQAIDGKPVVMNIPAYNGGLFALDHRLDNLNVADSVCDYFRELSTYDYRSTSQVSADSGESSGHFIDVEILGHIFEQSITDLERLRNDLDGRVEPKQQEATASRRKKEGAFYTPSFITRYIVEQALGNVLKDRFEQLRKKHESLAKPAGRPALADPAVYDLNTLTKSTRDALIDFWEAWQDELEHIRILDPACGSGAFLIEAFDQLHVFYQTANDRLEELRGSRLLFDPDRQILQSNLYGVDLNDEAIEICRLSLWIKTATKGKLLTSLDHTIRVGNSVVSDQAVHPRAFNWKEAFPEVFANGGFDVVIGNPPYIRQEWLSPFKPHWKEKFETFDGVADIFTYFFEVGVKLLRPGGRLGFITSGSWVRGNFGAPLRQFIAKNVAIDSMIDFGEYQPFEDAELIRPTIVVLRNHNPGGAMRLFKWLTTGSPPENLSDVIATASTMRTDHLSAESWELDPDDVLALRQKLATGRKSLKDYSTTQILRGVLSGLTEAFVVDVAVRAKLIAQDSCSAELLKPFAQGTHLRPWYLEPTGDYLLAIKSSANFSWPWSNAENETEAERIFAVTYPAVHAHLNQFRDAAQKRQDKGRFWWELRACGYWDTFDQFKIVWPDISKLHRFSMDTQQHYLGNTAYFFPSDDYYILGVLSSWTTWFYISKTAQPLRLRGDRWQYRLFSQFMENIPIPDAPRADQDTIAKLAEACSSFATKCNEIQTHVQGRMCQAFSQDSESQSLGVLNNKAQAWWELSLNELGEALKTSFKLKTNPYKKPQTADEWEPYLTEKRSAVNVLRQQLANAEAEINARVYRLFDLTPSEIALLEREVEH